MSPDWAIIKDGRLIGPNGVFYPNGTYFKYQNGGLEEDQSFSTLKEIQGKIGAERLEIDADQFKYYEQTKILTTSEGLVLPKKVDKEIRGEIDIDDTVQFFKKRGEIEEYKLQLNNIPTVEN